MDPQIRLLLEVAYEAMLDAGKEIKSVSEVPRNFELPNERPRESSKFKQSVKVLTRRNCVEPKLVSLLDVQHPKQAVL